MMALFPSDPAAQAAAERDAGLSRELFAALRDAAFDGVGITREAYSERESTALAIIEAKANVLGLNTERDTGANLIVTLPGSDPDLPFLACGSHLDSVPQGGNYDGAAGVIAGLAILAHFAAQGFVPRRTVKLYALRGEESARFGKAYLGSSALFGRVTPADLAAQDREGRSLASAMREVGVDVDRMERGVPFLDAKEVAGWVELHIEQGPVLTAGDLPAGIVTTIRGNLRHPAIRCVGEAGHSGAVPRALRHDALFAAAELIGRLDREWDARLKRGEDLAVTSGIFGTDPREHAIARIPGDVTFSIDFRGENMDAMEAFYSFFLGECGKIEKERGVEFRLGRRFVAAPAAMDSVWMGRLKAAAETLCVPFCEMASGAGHDAAVFANAGVPSAMIFVRNQHGSHNPREAMKTDDFVRCIAVMRTAMHEVVR
jgi:beta-ureidopropionase / N-carbamoyl-L-amino-acid hydrolase